MHIPCTLSDEYMYSTVVLFVIRSRVQNPCTPCILNGPQLAAEPWALSFTFKWLQVSECFGTGEEYLTRNNSGQV